MDTSLRRILGVLYPERRAPGARGRKRGNGASFSWKRFLLILAGALILIKLVLLFLYYNAFLSMQYDMDEAAAQVDAQLQRRKDIIMSLNVMVTDYAEHEMALFRYAADRRKEMVEARRTASREMPSREDGADRPTSGTAVGLEDALSRIFAIAERYPELRLSENFRRYMDALIDVEAAIAERRMIYNERANVMSTAVDKFPGFIFARLYRFEAPLFYEPEAEARGAPRVELLRQTVDTEGRGTR